MNDYDIQEEVDRLKGIINEKMHHSFLVKYMDRPLQNEEKLTMLYRMLRETSCSERQIDTYVVTIMLVQAALDAHDLITVQQLADGDARKSRQLTILGGDYYSGLYYHLLAGLEDIILIRKLARSIQEINEHKMFLYKSKNQTVENMIESLRVLESSLLRHTADHFDLPVWATFFEEYFLLRRLLTEKDLYLQSEGSAVIDALSGKGKKSRLFPSRQDRKQQLTQLLDSYINRAGKAVEKLFSNHTRFERSLGGTMAFFETGAFKRKLAEEG